MTSLDDLANVAKNPQYIFFPYLMSLNIGKPIQRLHSNQSKIIYAISNYLKEEE